MVDLSAEMKRRAEILKRLERGPEAYNAETLSNADEIRASLNKSAYDDISIDPRMKGIQNEALDRLGTISKTGYTAEEEAAAGRLRSQANQDDASRRASILQQMQMRGGGGGGAELAAMLSSADSAAERQSQGSAEAAANAQRRMLGALESRAQLAGQMQSEEYQRAARAAEARDRIKEFNANISGQFARDRVNARNQAAQANTGARNDWNWRTGELGYTDATNEMNRKMLEDAEKKKRKAQQAQGAGAAIGGIIGAGMGSAAGPMGTAVGASAGSQIGSSLGSMYSDEEKKENVKDIDDLDIDDFLQSLKPKSYDFKEGEGKPGRIGVIAQEIEETPIGGQIVEDSESGKMLDVENLLGAIVASLSRLEDKKKDKRG